MDHYGRLSSLCDVCILQSGKRIPLRSSDGFRSFEFTFARLRYALGSDRPSQTAHIMVLHGKGDKKH